MFLRCGFSWCTNSSQCTNFKFESNASGVIETVAPPPQLAPFLAQVCIAAALSEHMCAHIKAASDNAEKVAATALLAFVSALRSSRASADPATASAPPAAGASVSSLLVPIHPPPVKKAPKGTAKDSESADSAKPTKDRDASAKGSSSGRNNRTGPPGKGPSGTGRARSVAPPSRGRGRGVGREGGNLNRSQSHTPSGSGSHQHFSLASLGATLSHPWEPLKRTVNVGGRTVGVLQGAAIGALSLLLGASAGTQGLTEKAATATRFCARVATSASSSHLVLQVALPSTISPALRHGIARYGLRLSQMGREGLPGRESREPPEEVPLVTLCMPWRSRQLTSSCNALAEVDGACLFWHNR